MFAAEASPPGADGDFPEPVPEGTAAAVAEDLALDASHIEDLAEAAVAETEGHAQRQESEVSSGTSSSTSASGHTSSSSESDDADQLDPREVRWLLPKRANALLHAVADEVDENSQPVAWCRRFSNRAFAHGFAEGLGVHSAEQTERIWCPTCLFHLHSRGVSL